MKHAPLVFLALTVLIGVAAPRTVKADDHLVARWDLTSTESIEASPFGARLIGEPRFATDAPHALRFSGDGGTRERVVVEPGRVELPEEALTVEAWVRIERGIDWGGIVGSHQDNGRDERGWLLGYDKSRFYFGVRAQRTRKITYLRAGSSWESGSWYHVVGTFDGRVQRLYVDGALAASSTAQSGKIHYGKPSPLTIGAYRDDDELRALEGSIESVALWGRAFSTASVRERFDERKALFPEIEPRRPTHTDWPTYRHDELRSGTTPTSLQLPLRLAWSVRPSLPPAPAWALPAKKDFWHKKTTLPARVVYDHAFHVVSSADRVYFGSSSTDSVYCLDATTGETLWIFTTEGPVRLAPTIAGDRLLFGSDDGSVYCLDAVSGELHWKQRAVDETERIAGNERIIDRFPIRSGVLVDGKKALFCAGLFPEQGVFQVVVDIASGERLARERIGASSQGYLERRGGRLFTPTGRNPAGKLLAKLGRRGKSVTAETANLPKDFRFAWIRAGETYFGGGDGKIAAISPEDGRKLWSAKVDGKAYSLAVTPGRLFVSTDSGEISSFVDASAPAQPERKNETRTGSEAVPAPNDRAVALVDRILRALDRHEVGRRGYALVLGGSSLDFLSELARRSEMGIVVTQRDRGSIRSIRENLLRRGLCGRISIHHVETDRLPYSPDLFSVVLRVEQAWRKGQTDGLVRPGGIYIDLTVEESDVPNVWSTMHDTAAGEWTHMYADAANRGSSADPFVRGELRLQWFGRPGPRDMIDRHHRTVPPLVARGRLFVPAADKVIAVDAYNGAVLWEREIPDSTRVAAFRDSGSMATDGVELYVASGASCRSIDARTGAERLEHRVPPIPETPDDEWGSVAIDRKRLYGSAVHPGAVRRTQSLAAVYESYYDQRPIVTSRTLFAQSRDNGGTLWTRRGTFLQPTVTIGEGRLYVVDCAIAPRIVEAPGRIPGRFRLSEAFAQPARVLALDLASGRTVWSRELDLFAIEHNVYGLYSENRFVLVGSRNSGSDPKKDHILYDIVALDATTGDLAWRTTQRQPAKIGGSHGEQDLHPLIQNDRLICEPFAYRIADGTPSTDWKWKAGSRRGCGGLSASANALFFRQSNPTAFDVESGKTTKITTVSRPGCWINMIPAAGMLLIPEASSGCTCNYAVQGSLGFRPLR